MFLYLAHLAVHCANVYEPLQAPADVIQKFSYIKDVKRRKFAGNIPKKTWQHDLMQFFFTLTGIAKIHSVKL